MKGPTTARTMLLASTILVGLATPAAAQTSTDPVLQQQAPPTGPGAPAAPDPIAVTPEPGAEAGEVVVTGTRIRSANLQSVSPIVQVTGEEFQARGVVRAEDLLNQLPQVFAAQGSNASNEATGTAQVDLRGLTPSRTLVLVNGRRLPYGSPKATPSDVNQVPTPLIQNVEVLTGGASAVYGSDAIAGVVNFKLLDNFEGLRLTGNLSVFQHNNGDDGLRRLLDENNARVPGAYPKPDRVEWDGFAQEYSAVVGANVADGRGNVTAYGTYRKVNPVFQADRDYSACGLGTGGTGGNAFTCSGSGFNAPANFSNTQPIAGLPASFRTTGTTFVAGTQTFNFGPFNYYQRPDERYTLGALAHYEVNEHLIPYAELSFMDDRSLAQIAPGTISAGITPTRGGINCDNAFLSAQQVDFLCTSRGLASGSVYDAQGNYVRPNAVANGVLISRRNVEGGPRVSDLRHQSYRLVGGVRGKIGGPFEYDVSASYSNVSYRESFTGDSNRNRLALATNAVRDQRTGSATRGQIVCAVNADGVTTNDDPNCRPLDFFGANGLSPESVAYVAESKGITGDTSLTNIIGVVNGDLGKVGVTSPWATNGVGIAFGGEYRKNTLDYNPDEIYQTAVSPEVPVAGKIAVWELFGELNVPIVEDRAFFQLLSFEGAYRYSDYDTGIKTDTYKLGLNWAPVRDVRFRGSYQRAVRAPNVIELFSSQQRFEVNLTPLANGLFDPCAGPTPFATAAACARTGVTAAQYGNIVDNPAGQFNTLIGGNPNLGAETADTYSLGAVIQPSFVPGFTLSVDYFDINVKGLVGSVNPNLALTKCLGSGDPFYCGLIQRGQGGSLWLFDDGFFRRFNVNTGSLATRGIDVTADYKMGLDMVGLNDAGSLNFNLTGTYLDSFRTVPLPDSPATDIYECKGLYGGLCGRPRPTWRHKFLTSWVSPFDVSLALTWRYVSSVKVAQTSSQPALTGSFAEVNRQLNSRSYFDLSGSWAITKGLNLRLGVNNILDKDPPLTTVGAIEDGGNGNTYPQFYDALGRYIFTSVTLNL